jgi:hypothetical protein
MPVFAFFRRHYFLVTVVAIAILYVALRLHFLKPRPQGPLERLAADLNAQLVSYPDLPEAFWLTTRQGEELEKLRQRGLGYEKPVDWQGVVFCRHLPDTTGVDVMKQWGKQGFVTPEYYFFGDPVLIEQIRSRWQH